MPIAAWTGHAYCSLHRIMPIAACIECDYLGLDWSLG